MLVSQMNDILTLPHTMHIILNGVAVYAHEMETLIAQHNMCSTKNISTTVNIYGPYLDKT